MAEIKKDYLVGTTIVAFIKRSTDSAFVAYGCWTDNGFQISPSRTSSANKCNYGWNTSVDGTKGWTISGTLEVFDEDGTNAAGMKSAQTLAAIAASGEVVAVKLTNPDGTYYRGGNVAITAFQETANVGTRVTAQVTFTGEGAPDLTPPTA